MSGVLVDGRLIHYESLGRGKPLVFLHGWLGSWRYWVPVMENLALEYKTYALDLWGFGDSDKGLELHDVGSYAEMVLSLMDELGLWRVPLVGHTLGAAIAAELAARRPERVSRVLAVGLPVTARSINSRLLSAAPNEVLARVFWQKQRPHAEVEMSVAKTARNGIALTVQSVAQFKLAEILEGIEVPLLSIYGSRDNVIDCQQAEESVRNSHTARVIVLQGAHHFPMLDQSASFTRLLRDFLDVESPEGLQSLAIKREWRRRTR